MKLIIIVKRFRGPPKYGTIESHSPTGDNLWHGNPRKHKPSSSNSDSITNGGAKAVTIRKTDRALADRPVYLSKIHIYLVS